MSLTERSRGGRDGGRGTRGMIQQDVRPLQTARPLTREESREYTMDISERFYDDYRSRRNTGDARNEVTTKLQKLPAFDPELYKANAYRSLAYDPLRPVPSGLNFDEVLHRQLTATGGPRPSSAQRRLSDPGLNRYPVIEPIQDSLPPPRPPSRRPRSALQKQLDGAINPSLVPAVEDWLENASVKDRSIATKMLRTISREGQQREPVSNPSAVKRRSSGRIQSARLSEDRVVKGMYNELSNQPLSGLKPLPQVPSGKKLPRSKSETTTKGSMFASSQRTQPAHYTIHPDWTSEAGTHKKL
ncbi:uncharacterized protein [Dysidea avara]|uniref:uncharacterized protein n=1 Tax=Dysidea avara TaxID=196820 RepID=UPI0033219F5C